MKTFVFLLTAPLLIPAALAAPDASGGKTPSDQAVRAVFKHNCIKCHGGKKTKGDINLVAMLEREFSSDDINDWSEVFSQVQSGNMPPDDEEEPLTSDEEKIILLALQNKLGNAENVRTGRMITPDEYKNSIADLFQIDLKNYDPIGDLYAFVSPEHKFCTVKSGRMMNRFYLTALMDGTERIIREYHADSVPPPRKARSPHLTDKQKQKLKERRVKERKAMEDLKAELSKDGVLSPEELRVLADKRYGRLQNRLEGDIARRTPKSTNYTTTFKFPMKMSPKIKDTTDGFFEYTADHWGIRGKSWIGNNNMPIMLLGGYGQQFRILPPGKYRLTIRATATDRETIKNIYDSSLTPGQANVRSMVKTKPARRRTKISGLNPHK